MASTKYPRVRVQRDMNTRVSIAREAGRESAGVRGRKRSRFLDKQSHEVAREVHSDFPGQIDDGVCFRVAGLRCGRRRTFKGLQSPVNEGGQDGVDVVG